MSARATRSAPSRQYRTAAIAMPPQAEAQHGEGERADLAQPELDDRVVEGPQRDAGEQDQIGRSPGERARPPRPPCGRHRVEVSRLTACGVLKPGVNDALRRPPPAPSRARRVSPRQLGGRATTLVQPGPHAMGNIIGQRGRRGSRSRPMDARELQQHRAVLPVAQMATLDSLRHEHQQRLDGRHRPRTGGIVPFAPPSSCGS